MTFVRVSGNGDQDDPPMMPLDAFESDDKNPIMMLDQDQINSLENVLRSNPEAKSLLDQVLSNPDNNPNEGLENILTQSTTTNNPEFALIGPPPPLIPNSEVLKEATEDNKKNNNRRKSQRQLDRELKEEAERIRKENQEILKKEKEAMRRDSKGSEEKPTPPPTVTATTASGR